jgi:hypothetical protein
MTPAGAASARRFTSAMRKASRVVSSQVPRSIRAQKPMPPARAVAPASRRPFSSTITLMLSRDMGRTSVTRSPSGRRIATSWCEAESDAETCTTRESSARAKASISRSVSTLSAKVAPSSGSSSP